MTKQEYAEYLASWVARTGDGGLGQHLSGGVRDTRKVAA